MALLGRMESVWQSFHRIIKNPAAMSYYPDAPHKDKWTIVRENLCWLLRYREMNGYYFLYGKDCLDAPTVEQLPKQMFCRFRDRVNARGMIGDYRVNYNAVLQDKLLFSQYIKGVGISGPKVLALCGASGIRWLDTGLVEPIDKLLRHDGLDVFIKDVLGVQGIGVYHVQVRNNQLIVNGDAMDIEDFTKLLTGRYIVQERIRQHDTVSKLYPWSVNTIRILSAWDNGQIEVLAAMLRLGAGRRVFDNLSAGGICIGVDRGKGQLNSRGFMKPGFGKIVPAHPDTGVTFEGLEIPYWDQVVELVKRVHGFFYGTHSIGWDVAITPQGPILLEGNNSWEIPMLQLKEPDLLQCYLRTLRNHPLMKSAPRLIRKYAFADTDDRG